MKEKVIKFIIVALTALFSASMVCANTYYCEARQVDEDDSFKYFFATNNNKIELGFKVEKGTWNIVPLSYNKVDSIRKAKMAEETKIKEQQRKINEAKFSKAFDNFAANLLKLSLTILGILVIFFVITLVCCFVWISFGVWQIFAKKG